MKTHLDVTSINRKWFRNRMNEQWDLASPVLNSVANYTCKRNQGLNYDTLTRKIMKIIKSLKWCFRKIPNDIKYFGNYNNKWKGTVPDFKQSIHDENCVCMSVATVK